MLNVVTQRMELSAGHAPVRRSSKANVPAKTLEGVEPERVLNEWMQCYVEKVLDEVVKNTEGKEPENAGKFGFCFVCRKPAMHYCRDTKVHFPGRENWLH